MNITYIDVNEMTFMICLLIDCLDLEKQISQGLLICMLLCNNEIPYNLHLLLGSLTNYPHLSIHMMIVHIPKT